MDRLLELHASLNAVVWGPPMMVLLIGAGVILTISTGGVQFRRLGFAVRQALFAKHVQGDGSVTSFQALSASLAATVGVGNIAGVSTAISLGGPGALFWLFFSGVVGMATKFAEIAVALHYREPDERGVMRGGAMYILSKGFKMPWLGALFAMFTGLAAFGIGNMVQANSVADAAKTGFGVPVEASGLILAALTAAVVVGGLRRIVEVTQVLIPAMCAFYVLATLIVLARFADQIPGAIALVLEGAFEGQAAIGGFAGAGVSQALRYGIARGLFSNEAGLGSAPIVHASAVTDHPVRQASYGIFGVLVDTIIVCQLTGLVVLTTGAWQSGLTGAALSASAFKIGLWGGWGDVAVSIALILFAFSTVVGWAYYGETAVTYLFGWRAAMPYRVVWIVFVYIGAIGGLETIWSVADTLNGLMAVPNLIAILGSIALLRQLLKEFFAKGEVR